ncbi:MAG: hypothetical protein ABH877_01110, partial [bacterium]
TGGAASGTTDITCKVVGGSATPSAAVKVTNYGAVAGGHVRVLVLSEQDGKPLSGAKVRVIDKSGAAQTDAVTGADGTVDVDCTGQTPPQAVHVFHADYNWVSVYTPGDSDLLISTSPNSDPDKVGGFRGKFDFSKIPNPGEVQLGIAGASIPGNLINIDFTTLIGEMLTRHVKIGSLVDEEVPLPSGIVLTVSGENVKEDYQPFGVAGPRVAWGIGGKVPIAEIIRILTPLLSGGTPDMESLAIGAILAKVMPFFDNFRHAINSSVTITDLDKVVDDGTTIKDPVGNPNGAANPDYNRDGETTDLVANYQSFPEVNLTLSQPLTARTSMTPPTLPKATNGSYLEGVIVISGVMVPGRGLVPLGISAAVDAANDEDVADGIIDTDPDTAGNQSKLELKLAPKHGGIESGKFVFIVLALSLDFGDDRSNQISGFVVYPDVATGLPASITLPPAFLGFATGTHSTATRSFTVTNTDSAKTFIRAEFSGGEDKKWHVYFPGSGFALPVPPAGMTDRAGADSDLSLIHVRLTTHGSGGFSDFMKFSSDNMIDMVSLAERFALTDCKNESGTITCN